MAKEKTKKQEAAAPAPPSGGRTESSKLYVVDLRIFVLTVSMAMACSFYVGMTMVPIELYQLESGTATTTTASSSSISPEKVFGDDAKATDGLPKPSEKAKQQLPAVHSTNMEHNISQEVGSEDEEEHLPAGQHLLVDLKGVSSAFLNSEERLAQAMVDTVKESGLTLLSYHCHKLLPAGVSCVGVLLESHIAFHTWPEEGVITLDLFTCGSQPLLPVIPLIERLFGVPPEAELIASEEEEDDDDDEDEDDDDEDDDEEDDDEDDEEAGANEASGKGKIQVRWSHELRGFRSPEEMKRNHLADSSDLSLWVLSPLEMHLKEEIYAGDTKFQRIDIWDIVEDSDTPGHEDIIKYNLTLGDPRLKDRDYVTPERILFLNGTLQSMRSSERIYHEAMVHPAMFSHPKPKHVAVVGGGEGATLREVLKHNTIESAVMIELDKELVDISREHLPTLSDCSDLQGRSKWCLDDDLAEVYYEDGRKWFMERYSNKDSKPDRLFDVILMDALDPEDSHDVGFLYSDADFIGSLLSSLSEEGILAIQVGTTASIHDPRPDIGVYAERERLFNLLEGNEQVKAMLIYEEPHCGFLEPHSFLIVCKSASCRSRWYARSDQVDYEIYERIVRTQSKERALTFFDGMTQRSYQWPKKGWETVYCRREPMPFECDYRYMDPKAEVHDFVLPPSEDDEEEEEEEKDSSFRFESATDEEGKKTTSVFATVNIPKGSFIMADHLASSLMLTKRNLEGLEKSAGVSGTGRVAVIEDLLGFMELYAHPSGMEGSGEYFVELGASALIRRVKDESQANIGKWVPDHPSGSRPKYSPVYERHRMSFDVFVVATKDIAAGEEVLMYENMW